MPLVLVIELVEDLSDGVGGKTRVGDSVVGDVEESLGLRDVVLIRDALGVDGDHLVVVLELCRGEVGLPRVAPDFTLVVPGSREWLAFSVMNAGHVELAVYVQVDLHGSEGFLI